jgi:hypothetical protein
MPNAVLLPWEDENNNTTGSFNKKRRVTPIAWTNVTNASVITTELPDGAKPVERINAMGTAADSKKHLLTMNIDPTELDSLFMSKTNGEDHNNIPSSFYTKNNDIQRPAVQQSHDEECRQHVQQSHAELVIIQQMDNLEENVPFEPKVDKSRREYSDRVDELMTYKGKYGHLKK